MCNLTEDKLKYIWTNLHEYYFNLLTLTKQNKLRWYINKAVEPSRFFTELPSGKEHSHPLGFKTEDIILSRILKDLEKAIFKQAPPRLKTLEERFLRSIKLKSI